MKLTLKPDSFFLIILLFLHLFFVRKIQILWISPDIFVSFFFFSEILEGEISSNNTNAQIIQ